MPPPSPTPSSATLSRWGARHFTGQFVQDARKVQMDPDNELFFDNFICDFDDSLSDDEDIVGVAFVYDHLSKDRRQFRGSIPRHMSALNRNRENGHFLFWKDYFEIRNPLYTKIPYFNVVFA
ncbi:Nuclear pore complex protein [Hordeum vulgare]|nr:Nuclear pore complex protein [Hordeum vulgare]